MKTLTLPCDVGQVSDGYHTFNELYEHRIALFLALMDCHGTKAWRSELHDDGGKLEGWFLAGIELPTGMITYHAPLRVWYLLDYSSCRTLGRAPKWDGHTSADVVTRLHDLFIQRMPIM